MSWWRKIDPNVSAAHPGEISVSDTGTPDGWVKIKSIFRMMNPDTASAGEQMAADRGWIRIRSIWRKVDVGEYSIATAGDHSNGNDLWIKVYSYGYPSPQSDGPKFTFIESPYTSSANKSEDANMSTGAAWQNSKIYITRGKWQEDPIYFEFTFQKSYNKGSTWSTVALPGVSDIYVNTKSPYSNANYEDKIPPSSSSWPLISLSDVQNGVRYRVKIRVADRTNPSAEDLNSATYYFPSDSGISPRIKFAFRPYGSDNDPNTSGVSENELLSDYPNKKLAIQWRYDTSLIETAQNTNSYKNQIVEMQDPFGNRVIPLVDVPVTNTQTQSYVINYPQSITDNPADFYVVNVYTIGNDGYWTNQSLENHLTSDETVKLASFMWVPPLKPVNTVPPALDENSLNNRLAIGTNAVLLSKGTWTNVKEDTTYLYKMKIYGSGPSDQKALVTNSDGVFTNLNQYAGMDYTARFTVTATNQGTALLSNRQTESLPIDFDIDPSPIVTITSPTVNTISANTNFQIKATINNYPKNIKITTTDSPSVGAPAKDGINDYNNVSITVPSNTFNYSYESPNLQYPSGGNRIITVRANPGDVYDYKSISVPLSSITTGTVIIEPSCNSSGLSFQEYYNITPVGWVGDGSPDLILQYEYRLYWNGLMQNFNAEIPNKVGDLGESVGETLRGEVRAYFYNTIDLSKSIFTDWISSPTYTIIPGNASFSLLQTQSSGSSGGGSGQQVT